MAYGYDLKTQYLLSAPASVAKAATYAPGTASVPADVFYAERCRVKVEFTGSAGGAGKVTFNFVAIGHPGETYPTVTSFSVEANQNGAAAVGKDVIVDCSAYVSIALQNVKNEDASVDVSDVMATVDYKL